MDDWHNLTIQGQRNTAVAKRMKKRASYELTAWRKKQRESGLPDARDVMPKRRRNRK